MVAFPIDEISRIIEIRPGRHMYVRKVVLSAVPSEDNICSSSNYNVGTELQDNHIQLIFVHGLGGTEQQFQLLLQSLFDLMVLHGATSSSNIRITCWLYDHVGCGQSPSLRKYSDYTYQQIQDDFKSFVLYAQQQDSGSKSIPTAIIGHSYGPSIFVPLLSTAVNDANTPIIPNLVGIVLIGTSVRDCSYLQLPDGGHPIIRYLPVSILNCIQSSLTEDFIRKAVHPHHTTLQNLIRNSSNQNDMYIIQCYHCHTKWMQMTQLQQCVCNNVNSSNTKPSTQLPVLIIHGTDDGITPIQCAQYIHNHLTLGSQGEQTPTSATIELCVIEEASHLVMIEQPQPTAASIYEFIKRTSIR